MLVSDPAGSRFNRSRQTGHMEEGLAKRNHFRQKHSKWYRFKRPPTIGKPSMLLSVDGEIYWTVGTTFHHGLSGPAYQ